MRGRRPAPSPDSPGKVPPASPDDRAATWDRDDEGQGGEQQAWAQQQQGDGQGDGGLPDALRLASGGVAFEVYSEDGMQRRLQGHCDGDGGGDGGYGELEELGQGHGQDGEGDGEGEGEAEADMFGGALLEHHDQAADGDDHDGGEEDGSGEAGGAADEDGDSAEDV